MNYDDEHRYQVYRHLVVTPNTSIELVIDINEEESNVLNNELVDLGFELSKLDGVSVLKYRNQNIFILGDHIRMHSGFVHKLCDAYMDSFLDSFNNN